MAARICELFMAADANTAKVPDLDLDDVVAGEGGVVLRAHSAARLTRDSAAASSLTPAARLPIMCA